MSKANKEKSTDWFSIATLAAFFVVIIIGVLFAYKIYNDYKTAFGGNAFPPGVAARVQDEKQQDTSNSENSSQARSEWGQFGDFFGGTLNPIFGFVSILALFLTIIYQARELKLSTEELKKSAEALSAQNQAIEQQRFEQTFFSWLNTYRETLASLEDVVDTEGVPKVSGRVVLKYWFNSRIDDYIFTDILANTGDLSDGFYRSKDNDKFGYLAERGAGDLICSAALKRWERLYKSKEYQLDSFFRVLYRLIKWIDDQPVDRLSNEQKWFYVGIVRSQLSWYEMAFLYLNGMTERGQKFKPYLERFAIFDNLTMEEGKLLFALKYYSSNKDVIYFDSAYSSDCAKRLLQI